MNQPRYDQYDPLLHKVAKSLYNNMFQFYMFLIGMTGYLITLFFYFQTHDKSLNIVYNLEYNNFQINIAESSDKLRNDKNIVDVILVTEYTG